MKATVIIPTTGADTLLDAIHSVMAQTIPTQCYVVCDGRQYADYVENDIRSFPPSQHDKINLCVLPENVGANGFYGHRIYAAFTHLVNTEYITYLDQDNWLENNHIASCIDTITNNNLDWCYSLRNIYADDKFVCPDNCESLGKWKEFTGYNLIDTGCYCLKTEIARRVASVWHGGWGQDRVFMAALAQAAPKYDCTGQHTLNYRLEGNLGSAKASFFEAGNTIMTEKFPGGFPWQKTL